MITIEAPDKRGNRHQVTGIRGWDGSIRSPVCEVNCSDLFRFLCTFQLLLRLQLRLPLALVSIISDFSKQLGHSSDGSGSSVAVARFDR